MMSTLSWPSDVAKSLEKEKEREKIKLNFLPNLGTVTINEAEAPAWFP